jgi:uncharacterized membrane protein YhaH (DUF805 family)
MKYYYTIKNKKIGPLSIEELKNSDLKPNTLVWYNGLEKWTMLKNIPDLQKLINTKELSKYYLLEGKEKTGPFYIEELKNKKINPKTLVWTKELDEWTKAKELDELEDLILPDLPPEIQELEDSESNQNSYNNDNTNTYEDGAIKRLETNKKVLGNKALFNSGFHFQRPFSHKGRIGRWEYFITIIISSLINLMTSFILEVTYDDFALVILMFLYLLSIYFIIVNTAKRSHDIGNSGWWQLIPFYSLYLLFVPGEEKENEYGNQP